MDITIYNNMRRLRLILLDEHITVVDVGRWGVVDTPGKQKPANCKVGVG